MRRRTMVAAIAGLVLVPVAVAMAGPAEPERPTDDATVITCDRIAVLASDPSATDQAPHYVAALADVQTLPPSDTRTALLELQRAAQRAAESESEGRRDAGRRRYALAGAVRYAVEACGTHRLDTW